MWSQSLPSLQFSHHVWRPVTHRWTLRCPKTSFQESSAYDELVRLALAVDPSLTSLAKRHVKKKSHRHLMLGPDPDASPAKNKPPWLRQRGAQGAKYHQLKEQLSQLNLASVCQEAQCPNIGECWNGETGTATIMIMGPSNTTAVSHSTVATQGTPVHVVVDSVQ